MVLLARTSTFLLGALCLLIWSRGVSAADATITDATNPGERNFIELARALDAASIDASGELADVARLLLLASSRDAIRDAFRMLLPELSRHHVLKQKRAHRQPRRAAYNSAGAPAGAPILLASLNTPEIEIADLAALGKYQQKKGLWLQAWADRAEQDDRDDINGFESDTQGLAIGIDHGFTENWTLGMSVARQTGNIDSERFGNDDLESSEFSAYSSLSLGRNVVSAMFSYADNEIDRERVVAVNTDSGLRAFVLLSDVDSTQLSASLSWTGLYGSSVPFSVSPFASLSFARLETDDYLESGGGNVSLLVQTEDEEEFIGSVGLSLGTTRMFGNWLLAPNVAAAFEHDFNSDATQTLSQFRGTRFSFESRGFSVEENRWRFSFRLQLLHVDGFGLSLALETQRKDDYHYDAAIISVQTQF